MRLSGHTILVLLLVVSAAPLVADDVADAARDSRARFVASEPDAAPVFTNADLPENPARGAGGMLTNDNLPPAMPTGTPVSRTTTPEAAVPELSYDAYVDRDGHGREWWVARTAEVEARIEAAQRELDDAIEAESQNLGFILRRGGFGGYRYNERASSSVLRDAVRDNVAARDAALAGRESLAEACRRAGCLPAWVRPESLRVR